MSTRERWIVYPLLFLTLGIAMRDKIIPPARFGGSDTIMSAGEISARRILCNEIQAGEAKYNRLESGEIRAGQEVCDRLEAGEFLAGRAICKLLKSGSIIVIGPEGRPVVVAAADAKSHNGMIETISADGMPLVQLQSSNAGGFVVAISKSGRGIAFGETGEPHANQGPPQTPSKEQSPIPPTKRPSENENPEKSADKRDR